MEIVTYQDNLNNLLQHEILKSENYEYILSCQEIAMAKKTCAMAEMTGIKTQFLRFPRVTLPPVSTLHWGQILFEVGYLSMFKTALILRDIFKKGNPNLRDMILNFYHKGFVQIRDISR